MTRTAILLAFTIGCTQSATRPMPGDNDDNKVARQRGNTPCAGTEDFDGDGVADTDWTYSYDGLGRSTRDVGHNAANGSEMLFTYAWDNVDHLVHLQEAFPDTTLEYAANYDTLGDELDYTATTVALAGPDGPEYVITIDHVVNHDFDAAGHPGFALETTTGSLDRKLTYTYDELGRIITSDADVGIDDTIDVHSEIVYDDAARTSTRTTTRGDGGHTVSTRRFDADLRALSYQQETVLRDGTSTTLRADYEWSGDRLTTATYRSTSGATTVARYAFNCR